MSASPKKDRQAGAGVGADKLPLLDEVNELIEKERTLLNLKLLDQKVQAEEWKLKYDSLVEKVSGNVNEDMELDVLEDVGGSDTATDNKVQLHNITEADIDNILASRKDSWALNVSNLHLSPASFAALCKAAFGPRSIYLNELRLAALSNCGLTDDATAAVVGLCRSRELKALDLSNNQFGVTLFEQMVETLTDRGRTPDYLLLHGNERLASSSAHFGAVLEVLTEHTWGLTITLHDFNVLSLDSSQKLSKKHDSAPNRDYKELVKHPMKIAEFLSQFNAKLDDFNDQQEMQKAGKYNKKLQKAKGKTTKGTKKPIIGRENGLQLMCALGFNYAHMSKKSVTLLENALCLTSATLTDLDLSFGYVGFLGAQVLSRALSDISCQLVRLGLIGNSVGDHGAAVIGRAISTNRSLTALDLRSNKVSNVGCRALVHAIQSNSVMYVVDLRQNEISRECEFYSSELLVDAGSAVILRCRSGVVNNSTTSTSNSTTTLQSLTTMHSQRQADTLRVPPRISNLGSLLYEYPHKIRKLMKGGKVSVKLYSIDLSKINECNASTFGCPLHIRWKWRPCSLGTNQAKEVLQGMGAGSNSSAQQQQRARSAEAAALADTRLRTLTGGTGTVSTSISGIAEKQTSSSSSSSESRYLTLDKADISWRVRVVLNHQELQVVSGQVAPGGDGVNTRKLFGDVSEWIECRAVLPNIHPKGVAEVWIVVRYPGAKRRSVSGPGATTAAAAARGRVTPDASNSFVVEGRQLSVHNVTPTAASSSFFVGGDTSSSSSSSSSSTSSAAAGAVERLPRPPMSSAGGVDVYNTLASEYILNPSLQSVYLKDGFSMCRCFRWLDDNDGGSATAAMGRSVVLQWSSRLHYLGESPVTEAHSSSGGTSGIGQAAPTNHDSLSYRWLVGIIATTSGTFSVLAEGSSKGSRAAATARANAASNELSAAGSGSSSSSGGEAAAAAAEQDTRAKIIESWDWASFSISLPQLCSGDIVILAAKPESSQQHYPVKLLNKCGVKVTECHFNLISSSSATTAVAAAVSGYGSGVETAADVGVFDLMNLSEGALFAVHNDANCIVPL